MDDFVEKGFSSISEGVGDWYSVDFTGGEVEKVQLVKTKVAMHPTNNRQVSNFGYIFSQSLSLYISELYVTHASASYYDLIKQNIKYDRL